MAAASLGLVLSGCSDAPGSGTRSRSVVSASIGFFEGRLEEQPDSYATANALATRYLKRFDEIGRYKDVFRAEEVLRQGLDVLPTATGHARMATAMLAQHRFAEAEHQVRSALQLDARNAAVNASAFDVLRQRGESAEALSALERLDARGFSFLTRRAAWREQRGDYRGAELDFERACRGVESANTEATALAWCYTRQARAAYALDRVLDAGRLLHRALDVRAEYPGALEALAWMSYRAGALDRARHLYRRVLASGRQDEYDVHLVLAQIERGLGDSARADMHEATFERLSRQPSIEALYGHHLSAYLAETPDGAAEALRLARSEVAARPMAPSYEVLSWVLLRLGRVGEALAASRQSLAAGNSDATGLYRAGIVHLAAEQAEAGRHLLARALERRFELDPADERDIRRRLGVVGQVSRVG